MNGSVTKRGKKSWRIKFELVPNPITGRRRYHMETIRGTKREAEMQLAKRINALAEGRYVAPTAETLIRPMRGNGSRILRQPRAHRSQWTAMTYRPHSYYSRSWINRTSEARLHRNRQVLRIKTRQGGYDATANSCGAENDPQLCRQGKEDCQEIRLPISRRRPRQSAGMRSWSWMSRDSAPA